MNAHHYDVIVVGAGNAALTAALSARENGASVLVLEAASKEKRGGNSRFTGSIFRAIHNGLDHIKEILDPVNEKWYGRVDTHPYTVDDFYNDWMSTSQGRPNEDLVRITVENSFETLKWMAGKGVQFELTADKLFDPDKQDKDTTILLPPGGAIRVLHEGDGLIENLFDAAEEAGIEIWYDSPGHELITEGSTVKGVRVRKEDEFVDVYGVVILGAGGFESNPAMRLRYLGDGWDLVKVRGTAFNTGTMLNRALEAGAMPTGHWGGAHAVPLDANSPDFGSYELGDKTSRYSYPLSIMVNANADRFIDEGETHVFLTYAKTGWAVRAQPGAKAFQIFDQSSANLLEPRYSTGTPIVADTIPELAEKLGLDPARLVKTVETFNSAVVDDAAERRDPFTLDGVSAAPEGQPKKSNWATRIEQGPFICYPVTCGVTFTYGGLKTDTQARVIDTTGKVMPNLYAVGEIAGGFFFHNYGAGSGLMRGAVFGRIAGREAAQLKK